MNAFGMSRERISAFLDREQFLINFPDAEYILRILKR